MSKKSNIRSIRFSDELAALIEQQVGDTFTEKFTNLITKCVWELPQKEERLKQVESQIENERQQLRKMLERTRKLSMTLYDLAEKTNILKEAIENTIQQWET